VNFVTLIAEDLLLLLLDDRQGTVVIGAGLQPALGGAVLVELALSGAVVVEAETSTWRSAKVRGEDVTALDDPVLRGAFATVAAQDRSAPDLVDRLGKGLKDVLAERLAERGILERRDDKFLGLFPRTRWPAVDSAHEEGVRRALTAALVAGSEPDDRTGALIALLHAIGRAHRTVPHEERSRGEVKQRATEISEGTWAADAVRDAIKASSAAVAAAVTASVVVTVGG
jgi:hypothetical protein